MVATRKLSKSYRKGKHTIPVLRGVDLEIQSGEFLAIIGQSKSDEPTPAVPNDLPQYLLMLGKRFELALGLLGRGKRCCQHAHKEE